MLGISGTELVLILFFGFLIFGPEKLPQMGRTVGRAIRQFREASDNMNKKFKEEVADPFQDAVAPYKDDVENMSAPIKDDIAAINKNLQETRSAITDPFKNMLNPDAPVTPSGGSEKRRGVVVSAGTTSAAATTTASKKPADADPFGDVLESDEKDAEQPQAPEGKPIPKSEGTIKSSLAASLYGLDETDAEKDGE